VSKLTSDSGSDGVFVVIAIFEALSTIFQMVIFQIVFSASPKKAHLAGFVLCWIAFNPIQILCGFAHLGSLNDSLFYLIVMLPLIDDDWTRSFILNSVLTAVAAYFDPRILLLQIPIMVIYSRYQVHNSPEDTTNLRKQEHVSKEIGYRLLLLISLTVGILLICSEF